MEEESVGVEFHNQLDRKNIKNYLLSGAGLAVGDIDGNGLPDLFLISQDGPNKLFKQTAPWKFQDITAASGILDIKVWGSAAEAEEEEEVIFIDAGAPAASPVYFYRVRVAE